MHSVVQMLSAVISKFGAYQIRENDEATLHEAHMCACGYTQRNHNVQELL